jgi:hypothetical protein
MQNGEEQLESALHGLKDFKVVQVRYSLTSRLSIDC